MRYEFNLEKSIERTLKRYGLEHPTAAQWNFCLSRVHVPGLYRNSKNLNLDRLEMLMHEYVMLCYLHDMYISVFGFALLANISRETLYSWHREESRKGNKQAQRIFMTLKAERTISISNGLDDPKKVLGALATLRHECSWTKEPIESFVDQHGLIQPSKQDVSQRYKAILKA